MSQSFILTSWNITDFYPYWSYILYLTLRGEGITDLSFDFMTGS